MIVKLLKWLVLVVLGIALCLAAWLSLSSRAALDFDYTYTAAQQALPQHPQQSPQGLSRVMANGLEFRVRSAGCDRPTGHPAKPGVILLHGFPVTSAMWLKLIDPIADLGFCVVAPDMRGYSPGARPEGVDQYTVDKLVGDVTAIADAFELARFHLVGHDWGAVVGWATVLRQAPRVISWAGLSIAHPAAFGEALETDPEQRSRSAYFLVFSTPWLPEKLFTVQDMATLKSTYTGMLDEQVKEYLALFAEPGAMTAALNYYRAIASSTGEQQEIDDNTVTTPTLFIWGNRDGAVAPRGVELQGQYMAGPYVEIEIEAGHWLFVDQPEDVTRLLVSHLSAHAAHLSGHRMIDDGSQ